MFATSTDNCRLYFEAQGTGQVLVLLHAFCGDHTVWARTGWADTLRDHFTVVTPDLRGCGQSDRPDSADAYSIENHCLDIDKVVESVGGGHAIVWGWSLGATIAMYYAAMNGPKATIACGSYFGRIFTDEFVSPGSD